MSIGAIWTWYGFTAPFWAVVSLGTVTTLLIRKNGHFFGTNSPNRTHKLHHALFTDSVFMAIVTCWTGMTHRRTRFRERTSSTGQRGTHANIWAKAPCRAHITFTYISGTLFSAIGTQWAQRWLGCTCWAVRSYRASAALPYSYAAQLEVIGPRWAWKLRSRLGTFWTEMSSTAFSRGILRSHQTEPACGAWVTIFIRCQTRPVAPCARRTFILGAMLGSWRTIMTTRTGNWRSLLSS